MSIRTILLGIVASLFLTTGAAVIQGDTLKASAPPAGDDNGLNRVNCGIYILPTLPEPPKIQPMSDTVAASRKLSEEHLMRIIQEQREHIFLVHKKISDDYRNYIKLCGKSTQ